MAFQWELVKNNNCFLRKNLNGIILSAEPGNLYNKHSYKYSGICNDKTVDIQAADGALTVTQTRPKLAKNPAKAKNTFQLTKNVRKQLRGVSKDVSSYRPDLKRAALARVSALNKSLRVQQASKSS